MERPERPSRPEKVLVRSSGMHPYRERHRIVSSDSESDMEIDSMSNVRISNVRSLGVGVRLPQQRPIIDSSLAMPNPVGNSSSGTSSLSSDPYHIISPGRHIRDSINGDSSLLHQIPSSLLLKDDPCHRGIIYRKRPPPSQHFVSPISDDIDRRSSNSRNSQVVANGSTRIRFLPHHVPNSVCWDSKRFCPGSSSDSLPSEQKLQHTAGSNALHRLVTGASTVGSSQGLLLESSTSTAATERPERDDSRLRTWNSVGGTSDSPSHSDFIRFLYDNSPSRNDSEQIPYVRTEVVAASSSATGSHNGAGTLDLSRPSHSVSVPTLILPPLHLPRTVTPPANGSAAASSNGTSNPTASSTPSTSNNNNSNNNNNNTTNNSSCPVPCNSVEPITNEHPSESSSALNNGSNIVILSDPMSYELRESQRVPHRRYRLTGSGHSSSMQSDITDHPTRASSHILRALDELRFSPYREPWVNVVSHSSDLVPNAPNDLTTRGANGDNILSSGFSSAASNPLSSSVYRRRTDFPGSLSDDDESDVEDVEDIERVAIGTVVEDSDMDEFGSIIDRMQFDGGRNHQALLTHPTENNNQTSDDNPTQQNNSTGNPEGSSADNNGDPAPSTSANGNPIPSVVLDELPHNNVNCEEVEGADQNTDTSVNSQTTSSAAIGGNGAGADDVIILTPSPRRDNSQPPSQQQEDCAATTSQQSDAGQSLAASNDLAVPNPPTESSEQQNANPSNVAQQISEQLMDCQEFNSKLVSLLECPVCMETIVPPINQCKKGHPVCLMCRPKLNACPTCRARFSESRNLLMEKVAEMMLFPCKNAQMGCPVSVQLREKRKHEVSCGFRLYDCIFTSCSWKGFKPELVVHVSSLHKNRVIVGNNQKIRVPLERSIPHTWVLSVLDEVFIVTFVNQEKQLKGCTMYLGDSEKARKYMYEFLICKNRRQISWKEPTYSDDGQGYSFNLCREGFCMASEHKIIEQFLTRSHGYGVDVTIKIEFSEEQL